MPQRDKDVAFFVVWVLNKAAQAWGNLPSDVYRKLQSANIVDDYLIGLFDVVHTMGEKAILNDLEDLAAKRGLAL